LVCGKSDFSTPRGLFIENGKGEKSMGKVEQTFERLNKVLVEAGFPKAEMGVLAPCTDFWRTDWRIPLRFDEDGKYIAPEGGEYEPIQYESPSV
jgi:hypothetical protein